MAVVTFGVAALLALALAAALSDWRGRRVAARLDTGLPHGPAALPRGWRGWDWEEDSWDRCWPDSPGTAYLRTVGQAEDLAGVIGHAIRLDLAAELERDMLMGSGSALPWRSFT